MMGVGVSLSPLTFALTTSASLSDRTSDPQEPMSYTTLATVVGHFISALASFEAWDLDRQGPQHALAHELVDAEQVWVAQNYISSGGIIDQLFLASISSVQLASVHISSAHNAQRSCAN